jgi:ATP-dependent helicase/nuclease subunit B
MTRSLYDELRADAFQPLGMELRSEYGVIDRVDGYREPDGGLYLRVVDYKTGLTAFDFRDIRHGLGLQPLLYLFAVAEGAARPAGALYWPARETLVQAPRGASREEILALANLSLRRSGLLLDKPGLPPPGRASERVPTATAEQFDRLRGFVKRVAAGAADSLRRGETAPNPYDNGTRTACDYCPYAAACGFDPAEDEMRVLERTTPEQFWAFVEQDERGDAR